MIKILRKSVTLIATYDFWIANLHASPQPAKKNAHPFLDFQTFPMARNEWCHEICARGRIRKLGAKNQDDAFSYFEFWFAILNSNKRKLFFRKHFLLLTILLPVIQCNRYFSEKVENGWESKAGTSQADGASSDRQKELRKSSLRDRQTRKN